MARTAPVPNIPAIPGMNPGVFIMGGGGAGGGKGGRGGKGNGGDQGGDGKNGGKDAQGGGKGTGDCGQGNLGGCTNCHRKTSAGDPVDVATGEVFTLPSTDLDLPGVFRLLFKRQYSSAQRARDAGLGPGWGHSFAWSLEEKRGSVVVRACFGAEVRFDRPDDKSPTILGDGGWVLHRGKRGYYLDTGDQFTHVFLPGRDGVYRLRRIQHLNGNAVSLHHDRRGRLVAAFDASGRHIRFRSDDRGHITSIDVPNAEARTTLVFAQYAYDDRGDLVRYTDADGLSIHYVYDDDHRIVRYSYDSGLTFHFVHDAAGRCVETWGDYGGAPDPALARRGLPELLRDGQTKVRGIFHVKLEFGEQGYTERYDSVRYQRFTSNEEGDITHAVGAGVTSRVIGQDGAERSHTDPLGGTSTYEYNWRGSLIRETDPLGRVFTIERDADDQVVRNIDFAGGERVCVRDDRGNPVQVTNPNGRVTTYTYDARSLMTTRVDPDGGEWRYACDAHGNLAEVTTPAGAVWRWTHDHWGRITSRTDPKGGVEYYQYSRAGRLLEVTRAGGRRVTFTYDAMGNVASRTDQQGTTHYLWGGFRWPCGVRLPNGDEVRSYYNHEGWIVECHNERGEVETYERDLSGNLVRIEAFDGSAWWMGYDAMGRLSWQRNAAEERFDVTRDAAGRETQIAFSDDTEVRIAYDLLDRIEAVEGPGYRVEFTYDGVGNVVEETQTVRGARQSVALQRDAVGFVVGLRTSFGQEERVERSPFRSERIFRLDPRTVVAEQRDRAGLVESVHLPEGALLLNQHDAHNRLTRRTVVRAGAHAVRPGEPAWVGLDIRGATVDKVFQFAPESDNLLARWDGGRGATRYTYDQRGRLLERSPEPGAPERFTHDATGNLHEVRPGGTGRAYAPGDRLVEKDGERLVWDAVGRLVERVDLRDPSRRWRYAWNAHGQLAAVERPDGVRVELLHDFFHRRLEKRVLLPEPGGPPRLAAVTRFLWRGAQMIHEHTTSYLPDGSRRAAARSYAYAAGRRVPWAHRDHAEGDEAPGSGAWWFYVGDILGTPEELVDARGEVGCRLDRTAYGVTEVKPGGKTYTPFRFEGQYADPETGLVYNMHRYYDPALGRYISPDPLGISAGPNRYMYCPNPIGFVDPEGLHELNVQLTTSTGDVYSPGPTAGHRDGQGGGFSSGYTSAPGVLKKVPEIDWSVPPTTNTSLTTQAQSHTERQAIEWAKHHFSDDELRGGHMEMNGQYPPCPMCSNQMRKFAKEKGCKVTYGWPPDNRVTYDPKKPNDSPKHVSGDAARRVSQDYAPNTRQKGQTPTKRYMAEMDELRKNGDPNAVPEEFVDEEA
ncbi:RHS repeat-associated core domain-containing protein [Sorangium sp. So ce1335]|uniref:RHS repeat-associated core domain-containing protein n=1 Tax=Sorangium sp. So ce1335 TaxID=3133335 RepID=UPI003F63B5C6